MPPVTYEARTGIEEEERRRGRNTWVRVHASLQPLFLGENDAAAEKGMPCFCDKRKPLVGSFQVLSHGPGAVSHGPLAP